MTHATRVLGVDPGLTRCGVAVIEGSAGQKVSLLHVGVFRTDPGDSIEQRLISIEPICDPSARAKKNPATPPLSPDTTQWRVDGRGRYSFVSPIGGTRPMDRHFFLKASGLPGFLQEPV